MKHIYSFLLCFLSAGFSACAYADTLHFTGVGGNQSDGVYTYPYDFTTTIGGVTKSSVPLMCVDFNREITFDESWAVSETYIPRDTSPLSQQLQTLAIIDWGLLHPTAGNSSNDYQFAAWSIFDPTGVAGKNGMTAAAQTIATNALHAEEGVLGLPAGFSYSDVVLFSPTTDETGWTDNVPQRFIGLASPEFQANNIPPVPSPTPEPSGLLLVGTGILGAAGVMYRRVKAGVAGV